MASWFPEAGKASTAGFLVVMAGFRMGRVKYATPPGHDDYVCSNEP